tara:strand:+ start:265 stop:1038 length:774 start_codon:yes stop_codon:yes gene_type:complete
MKIKISISYFFITVLLKSQDFTAEQIINNIELTPKPNTSITEVKLEITRYKHKKKKIKLREFTRFQKFYNLGEFKSKSIIRFYKPKIIKGAGLLSWVRKNGQTDQWIFLPKLKTAKQIKAKEKSKKYMGTDFRYEDLENRKLGQDSLIIIGNEYIDGFQCKVLMAYPKDESVYFSRKIWINSSSWQIIKIEFYLDEFQKEKTLTFSNFITKDKYITPGVLSMTLEDNRNKTVMTIKSFKPDIGLKDEIFSKSFLMKI